MLSDQVIGPRIEHLTFWLAERAGRWIMEGSYSHETWTELLDVGGRWSQNDNVQASQQAFNWAQAASCVLQQHTKIVC